VATPTLAAVVPVLDGAATLDRCLTALGAELPPGAELIVVDDGSTDETPALASHHGATVIQHACNRGTSAARNTGWRASAAERVLFVDADVVVRPGSVQRMMTWLDDEPELLGVNGLLTLEPGADGLVSAFANTSIHFQHRRHGERVCSAFTSICLMRRAALERMGGWDERWFSRYGDDVATRFELPCGSIRMEPDAQGEHLKTVRLRGLLKHRFNVGFFFLRICRANAGTLARQPLTAVLHRRYPLNTAAAAGFTFAAGLTAVAGPLAAPAWLPPAALAAAANARFCLFTLRERGPLEASAALPLSVAEGFAYLGGMAFSAFAPGEARR
jgi:glycosyltransferase involved in cell wall biosynthesis